MTVHWPLGLVGRFGPRSLLSSLICLYLLVPAAGAEHGPNFDLACSVDHADIVLDPGHGGEDPGAVNDAYGLYESELNLQIALQVQAILQNQHDYSVVLTRTTEEVGLGNSERGEFANACGALVFVEIHLNASTDPEANYSQTFWAEKEKDLAFSLVMNDALAALGLPVLAVDRFDNGGLWRARMPSVLVESVFLSNPQEAAQLATGTRQPEIAEAIANGIASWMTLVEE